MGVQIVFPDFSDALLEGTGAQRESTCACVYGHTQLVVYQGQALKLAHYGPQLHIVAFQELAACRDVEEEVPDHYVGTGRAYRRFLHLFMAAAVYHPCAECLAFLTGLEFHL